MKQIMTLNIEEVRSEAKRLLDQINAMWYDFSLLAYRIEKDRLFEYWGYASSKDYAEHELGIDYRTWKYRVTVGETIFKHGISKEEGREIGYSKMKKVASIAKTVPDKVNEIINDAKTLNNQEFTDKVRSLRPREHIKKILIFSPDSYAIVEMALDKASKILGTKATEVLIEYICSDWLEHYYEEENQL